MVIAKMCILVYKFFTVFEKCVVLDSKYLILEIVF